MVAPFMKKKYLFVLLLAFVPIHSFCQANKSTASKTVKKATPAPKSSTKDEILLGHITTAAMTIKIHRAIEVVLSPCTHCLNSETSYTPKPNHRTLLFEITRRNPNNYILNAQIDNCTPLYARIIGTDGLEYACHTIPSLIELAMAQNKGISAQNAPMYYALLGPAPARSDQRAFALAVEMPLKVQPRELIWRKGTLLSCPLVMAHNKK